MVSMQRFHSLTALNIKLLWQSRPKPVKNGKGLRATCGLDWMAKYGASLDVGAWSLEHFEYEPVD
ncbi:MAG TPA: hypothetical protein VF430_04330 [Verrucomicrobiae bacterium]